MVGYKLALVLNRPSHIKKLLKEISKEIQKSKDMSKFCGICSIGKSVQNFIKRTLNNFGALIFLQYIDFELLSSYCLESLYQLLSFFFSSRQSHQYHQFLRVSVC